MRTRVELSLVMILTTFFIGCGPTGIKSPADVEGQYVFSYPSGQVELLSMKEDLTYKQELYSNNDEYIKGLYPEYVNSGKWSYHRNELEFEHWLEFCASRYPSELLSEPQLGEMSNVYWTPNKKGGDAIISVFSETGYVFKRINARSEVKPVVR